MSNKRVNKMLKIGSCLGLIAANFFGSGSSWYECSCTC